jgi:hypothetical protein
MVARSGQLQAGMFGLKGDRPLPRPGVVGRLVEGASMLLQIIWEWGAQGPFSPCHIRLLSESQSSSSQVQQSRLVRAFRAPTRPTHHDGT